ncbi:MAG: tRNA 2-thiocytidine biosynthesis protein TtcA [Bacilli bacterium]|nr:tRNA 2-thiocytidine biosynthesis protein TtcA [Bacilli bacterium]
MERYQEIERSIIKKYRKDIWSKFVKAVIEYELIKENDKIMICISGGKDSFLLAKCMEELQKHGKFSFEVHYVCMNPGYNEKNLKLIKENAKTMNINLEIFESDIFDVVSSIEKSPCYLCARMRRGCLYKKAQDLGCNKIALGHHFDDVIETTLLSMFYGAEIKTMMPKLHSENFEGLELIRPLHLVKESDIKAWAKANNLQFLNCACHFTERTANKEEESKRLEMKQLVEEMRKKNPNIDYNIYKALDNVNLNCVIGTKANGEYKSFLEEYEE